MMDEHPVDARLTAEGERHGGARGAPGMAPLDTGRYVDIPDRAGQRDAEEKSGVRRLAAERRAEIEPGGGDHFAAEHTVHRDPRLGTKHPDGIPGSPAFGRVPLRRVLHARRPSGVVGPFADSDQRTEREERVRTRIEVGNQPSVMARRKGIVVRHPGEIGPPPLPQQPVVMRHPADAVGGVEKAESRVGAIPLAKLLQRVVEPVAVGNQHFDLVHRGDDVEVPGDDRKKVRGTIEGQRDRQARPASFRIRAVSCSAKRGAHVNFPVLTV